MKEPGSRPRVFAIVLNWNRWLDTIECLESVLRQHYPELKVILCDNNSDDDSLARIQRWASGQLEPRYGNSALAHLVEPAVTKPIETASPGEAVPPRARLLLIQTGSNLGFAGGVNAGIRMAQHLDPAAWCWILNNDTVVDAGALSALIEQACQDQRFGIVGSKLLYYESPDVIQAAGGGELWPILGGVRYREGGMREGSKGGPSRRLDYVMGASMLIRPEVFRDVGLLDEHFFLGWEEPDFCLRARRAGWKLGYAEASRVWHKDSATVGKNSETVDFYGTRNSIIFLKRYYPWALPTAVILGGVFRLVRRVMRGQLRRIPLILKAYAQGLTAGRRGVGKL